MLNYVWAIQPYQLRFAILITNPCIAFEYSIKMWCQQWSVKAHRGGTTKERHNWLLLPLYLSEFRDSEWWWACHFEGHLRGFKIVWSSCHKIDICFVMVSNFTCRFWSTGTRFWSRYFTSNGRLLFDVFLWLMTCIFQCTMLTIQCSIFMVDNARHLDFIKDSSEKDIWILLRYRISHSSIPSYRSYSYLDMS